VLLTSRCNLSPPYLNQHFPADCFLDLNDRSVRHEGTSHLLTQTQPQPKRDFIASALLKRFLNCRIELS